MEERNRIARDLHDTLAQSLAAIALQLESAQLLTERGDAARAGETIERTLQLTRAALDDARRSVMELRAPPLEGQGLLDAIRVMARDLRTRDGAPIVVSVAGAEGADALPVAVESGLFHIAREALANAARHARTSAASVALERRGDDVELRVADEGVGFDVAAVPPGRFGLLGMSERARLLGGLLRVASEPGAGTTIAVTVPIRASAFEREPS